MSENTTNLDAGYASGTDCVSSAVPLASDRRNNVRRLFTAGAGTTCPHCGGRLTPNHLRDTGDVTECPIDACAVLFAKRASTADWTPPHGIPRPLHIVRG